MRTTQFIGLIKKADEFIKNNLVEDVTIKGEIVYGMFGEEIPLRVFKRKDVPSKLYFEVEQVAPWSSGPMIFTCLDCGGLKMFEWVEDKDTKDEFDYETGTYYV